MATLSRNDAKNKINRGAFHRQAFGPHASQVIGFLWIFEILAVLGCIEMAQIHASGCSGSCGPIWWPLVLFTAQASEAQPYFAPMDVDVGCSICSTCWNAHRDKEVVLAAVASSCWAVKYVTLAELARKLTQLCSHLFRTTREQLQWSAQRSFFAIVGDVFDRKTEPSRPFPIERLHFTTRPRYPKTPYTLTFFFCTLPDSAA